MKFHSIFLLFLPLLGLGQISLGQQSKIDSLQAIIERAEHDSLVIKAWIAWDDMVYRSDPELHLELNQKIANRAGALLEDHQRSLHSRETYFYQYVQGLAWGRIGWYYTDKGNYAKAIEYQEKCLKVRQALNLKYATAHTLSDLGVIYGEKSDYGKAMEYFTQSLSIREELGTKRGIASSYKQIGRVYSEQGDLDKSMEYLAKTLEIYRELNDTPAIATALHNIGYLYDEKGEYDTAMDYYTQSLKIYEPIGQEHVLANFYVDIALHHHRLKQYDQAREIYAQSLSVYEKLDNNPGVAYIVIEMGRMFEEMGNYEEAIAYSKRGYDLGKSIGNTARIKTAAYLLYKSYKQVGNDREALKMYEAYIAASDSLESRENQKATIRFEYERKALSDSLAFVQANVDTRLAYQRKLNKRNNLIVGGIGIGLLIFLFFRYRQQLRQRKKEQELERERERKEQLAELNSLKSRFFANISHELRTPLTLILGPLSHILDQPDAWEKESVRDQLTLMRRNDKSLMHLIEEILDLSKLEAKKFELEEQKTPLKPFIERIFTTFAPQFENHSIRFEMISQFDESLTVVLDRRNVEKVLNNYLSNAVKFTPAGGQVRLRVRESGDTLQFMVSDTGKGIHSEDLQHLFDRYYQARHDPSPQQGGTGIGLSLVNEIAHLMNGKAFAESTPGKGSQFYFEIPKKAADSDPVISEAPEVKPEPAPIYSIGTDFNILVVEDNADMRSFIHQLLAPRYKQVFLANNGAEGLKLLKKQGNDIHLIVSDIMMPEMDGMAMLEAIKADKNWQHIPVVMLTALTAERNKLSALTIGAGDYLTKPFSSRELQVRIQNLLYNSEQKKQWIQSAEYQQSTEDEQEDPATQISSTDKQWIEELETVVISSLPDNRVTAKDLAKAVHQSPRTLLRRVKAITGLSTIKFIQEVQLKKARNELENGTVISLAELAFRSGFEHQSTFSTLFKARYGISPREYLKAS